MNDIDPAKMTEAERMALFASFTKELTPAAPPRRTIAELIALGRLPSGRKDRAVSIGNSLRGCSPRN